MDYKKIFIDSDILLDLLLKREPFDKFSQLLLQQAADNIVNAYSSTLIFANINYMLTKNFSKHIAKHQLNSLFNIVKPLPFDPNELKKALISDHPDLEDTIQYYIAEKNECDLIISRNTKHYKKFDIPVLTAEQFLRTL